MTLSLILKQLREELQLQQKELAELLGVNLTTVNRWGRCSGYCKSPKSMCKFNNSELLA